MHSGIRDIIIASCFFSIMNVIVKLLEGIPAYEVAFFRALISFVICAYYLKKNNLTFLGNNKPILILRGLTGTIALVLFFHTLQNIPLATAVTLQYLSPIFTILFAGFVLREKSSPLQWLLFLGSFGGVVLIKGFNGDVEWRFIAMGVGAAISAGFAYNFVRKLRTTDPPMRVVFYFPLVALVVLTPFTVTNWVAPQGWQWLGLLGVGVLTQIAQVYMTRAYQSDRADRISIYNYLTVVNAVILGYVFFAETIDLSQASGIAVIFICLVLSSLLRRHTRGEL